MCPRCGRLLPAARRFCDCGTGLVRRVDDLPIRVPHPPSWWGEWAAHRRFRDAQRAAAGGAPVPYDVPTPPRTWFTRLLLVVLVLGVLAAPAVALLGPWPR